MTRPRVPDNKRQRTARACDSCKRRKQKCNGLNPCNTCLKRNLSCEYIDGRSPPKSTLFSSTALRRRRHVNEAQTPAASSLGPETASTTPMTDPFKQPDTSFDSAIRSLESQENGFYGAGDTPATSDAEGSPHQSMISETDDDEDIEMVRQSRMLEDASNRLFYLGDSSSYAFVQLVRMIVDNAAGPSPFTIDPHRHKMLDPPSEAPVASVSLYVLPGREAADLIVRSFFINTRGIIDIFDRRTFDGFFNACYANPLTVGPSMLCCVYLVLAVGLAMAAPVQGSFEESVFQRLQSEQPLNRAEALFRAAKSLADPMNGADDSDLWVIQSRILMTLYLMITAKTTAAYSYCGMAVRSACALGIHRTRDTMSLFSNSKEHIRLRWNIWRSLFVLDRFLAVSLGRPCAISEDDCPYEDLKIPPQATNSSDKVSEDAIFTSRCLDSSVKSARSLGQIIRALYSKDTISTRAAQSIVDECDLWSMNIHHPSLSPDNISQRKVSAERGIAILHVYLLHYHSIILLTRPFFIHLVVRWQTSDPPPRRAFLRVEKFSQACVAASTWSISLIREVYDAGYLPRRNPFILYLLFSAAVVILSNEFSGLYQNDHYATCTASIFHILDYCAETDAQAPRVRYIVKSFHSAVEEHLRAGRKQHQSLSSPILPIKKEPLQALNSGRRAAAALHSSPPTVSSASGWSTSHHSQHVDLHQRLPHHSVEGGWEEADEVGSCRRTSTQSVKSDPASKAWGLELDFGGMGGNLGMVSLDEREEYAAALHLFEAHMSAGGGCGTDPIVGLHGFGTHIHSPPYTIQMNDRM